MRRYLFTALEPRSLADFEEGVAIAVAGGRIIWSGEVAALGSMPEQAPPRRAELFVHLLARTAEERRGIIQDLTPIALPGGRPERQAASAASLCARRWSRLSGIPSSARCTAVLIT